MSKGRLFVVAVLWTASLLGVGLWAQGDNRGSGVVRRSTQESMVISGENIGFRRMPSPTGEKAGTITGRVVVKVDGVWLEVVTPTSFQAVPAR